MPSDPTARMLELLAASAVLWLATGLALLAFTPLRAHTAQLGWTPLFWLVLAPACTLAGLAVRPHAPARR